MAFYEKTTLKFGSKLIDFSTPQVMGIINLTTDSYFAESRVSNPTELLAKAEQMFNEGVTILDLGAMSSRPGAIDLGVDVELERLIPSVKLLKKAYPESIISIDTYRSEVARQCVAAGADMINDISGGLADRQMMAAMAELQVPYVMMHMKGMPNDMQADPIYENVVTEVYSFLYNQCRNFIEAGVKDIIIDLGFGFGKTVDHNYQLLENISHFKSIGHPILIGISRKSMIYKPLGITPEESLPATSALHMLALNQGASVLRVHDVKEAVEVISNYKLSASRNEN